MEITAATFVAILAVIGLLALLVSVITEVTKGVVLLSKIPVNLQVIVLSLTLTILTYFAYISYSGEAIIWYYVFATIVAGFVVAYVVLFGWDKFTDLYRRFRNIPPIDMSGDSLPEITSTKAAITSSETPADSFVTNTTTITNETNENRLLTHESEYDRLLK